MSPLRVFLLPSHYCGLGAGSIPLRATVNEKQCETRGLLMSLVIHYWIRDVQVSHVYPPPKWPILCRVGVKLYSLNHPVPLTITRVISRTGAAGGAEVRRRVVVCCRPRTRRTSTRTGTERTAKRRCSERRRSGKTKRSSLHLSTCHQRWKWVSGGFKGVRWGPPPLLVIFFQKAAFFRVKGIYFVVHICDKWGRSW